MVMRTQVAASSGEVVVRGRGELEVVRGRGAISKSASSELGSGEKRGGRGRWKKSLVQAIKVSLFTYILSLSLLCFCFHLSFKSQRLPSTIVSSCENK